MSPQRLLAELRRRGVTVLAHGDRLRVTAPVGTLSPSIREQLSRRKAELLHALGDHTQVPLEPLPVGVFRLRTEGAFRYVDGFIDFGDIAWDHTPASWAAELRVGAARCDQYRPDIADYFRRWAAFIEKKLGSPGAA